MTAAAPTIFVVAGEASGDLLGGRLMARLRERTGDRVRFAGVGGPMMIAQGLEPLFPMEELSVMGLAEVVPKIPVLLRRIGQTEQAVRSLHPDALVTIDAPDFAFRVARRLGGLGIPRIHYVAPTVWAWRPGRAKKIARFLDHLLALLPFEPPYFERVGLPCSFVGHPAVEGGAGKGDAAGFRVRHGITPERAVVVMMPGSRGGEVGRLLPVFVETLKRLQVGRPPFTTVVPLVPHVAETVRSAMAGSGLEVLTVTGEAEKFDAFAAARAALAKSGTTTLELALSGVPTVVAYKVSPISYAIARRVVKVPHVGLPNIVLDRPLMPELLQDECNPDRLERALGPLLDDEQARRAQVAGMEEVRSRLSVPGTTPSGAAADIVLRVIAGKKGPAV